MQQLIRQTIPRSLPKEIREIAGEIGPLDQEVRLLQNPAMAERPKKAANELGQCEADLLQQFAWWFSNIRRVKT